MNVRNDAAAAGHSYLLTHFVGPAVPSGAVATATERTTAREDGKTSAEAKAASAILDLVLKLSQAEGAQAAARMLANEAKNYLQCDRVAVGLRRGSNGRCRLAAVSGITDVDGRGDERACLEAALDEAVLRESPTFWTASDNVPHDAAIAHRQLAAQFGAAGAISAPLRSADGSIIGAWTLIGTSPFARSEINRRFISAASAAAGTALTIVRRAEGGPLRRGFRQLARVLPRARWKVAGMVATLLAAAMFIPIPYYVSVECELQPVVRRFVAAPYAGEFQKSLVKPGDLVKQGQLLARMDGREIRWELAGLTAERERARKSRDVNLAEGKAAAAQIDQLESQRQQVHGKLLEDRLARLEVRSPIDGIVVSGDLERSEGVPVTIGQELYEIAPLDRMTAELAIGDEEISHVTENMSAAVRFDAYPQSSWNGDISRIHPRSVTRERDNVFLGEVELGNADGTLRPGMKGQARIRAANRCLGWVLFHKPWNYLCSWLDI